MLGKHSTVELHPSHTPRVSHAESLTVRNENKSPGAAAGLGTTRELPPHSKTLWHRELRVQTPWDTLPSSHLRIAGRREGEAADSAWVPQGKGSYDELLRTLWFLEGFQWQLSVMGTEM